jgi:hypothetical protein
MLGLALWLGVPGGVAHSEEAAAWPPFQQVLESIEANLPGLDRAELNAVIVRSLLDHFYPRVTLVPTDGVDAAPVRAGRVDGATVFDRAFGYLRVHSVGPGLGEQLREAWVGLASENRLQGLVLDLRFADGQDYEAAAHAADLFIAGTQPLLAWHDTVVHATETRETAVPPIVVLVNRRSSGAAETLAAVLRENGVALLVGTRTAGQAYVFRDITLPEGRVLRVAAEPIRVGDRESVAGGVTPDIEVTVSLSEERQYLADPYAIIPGATAGTALRPERSQMNEAELMRQRQPGARPGFPAESIATTPARLADPVVQDPALARALDLLKGIAIVGRAR